MKLKPWQVKLMLNAFPALFFQRIRVRRVSSDFREMDVIVKLGIFNRNLQGSVFGGTLFSSADPFFAILYWQLFAHKDIKCEAWLRAAEADYIKPASTSCTVKFRLTEEDVSEAFASIEANGRFKKWHVVEAVDKHGNVCARFKTLVYLRKAAAGLAGI